MWIWMRWIFFSELHDNAVLQNTAFRQFGNTRFFQLTIATYAKYAKIWSNRLEISYRAMKLRLVDYFCLLCFLCIQYFMMKYSAWLFSVCAVYNFCVCCLEGNINNFIQYFMGLFLKSLAQATERNIFIQHRQ